MVYRILIALTISSAAYAHADRTSEVAEVMAIAKEAVVTAGLAPAEAARRLTSILRDDYAIDVRCDERWPDPLSGAACWLALKDLARAVYAGTLPKIRGAFTIELTRERDVSLIDRDGDPPLLRLPHKAGVSLFGEWMRLALESSTVRQSEWVRSEYSEALARLQANCLFSLEFAPGLPLARRWAFVNRLTGLGRRRPEVLDRQTQVLLVGHRFVSLREKRMRLYEEVDASADAKTLEDFLTRPTEGIAERYAALHARVEQERQAFATRGVQVECNPEEGLTLAACDRALARLSRFVDIRPGLSTRFPRILILENHEIENEAQTFSVGGNQPNALGLRESFTFAGLEQTALSKGWMK